MIYFKGPEFKAYADGSGKEEKKHRKLFGSLFKKKNKYEAKTSSTDDEASISSGGSGSKKKNK